MNITFARTEISTLNCVVEQTVHTVPITLIILSGIDSALRRNTVCTARRIMKCKDVDLITEFGHRGCR